jgi:hypothetical protein
MTDWGNIGFGQAEEGHRAITEMQKWWKGSQLTLTVPTMFGCSAQ